MQTVQCEPVPYENPASAANIWQHAKGYSESDPEGALWDALVLLEWNGELVRNRDNAQSFADDYLWEQNPNIDDLIRQARIEVAQQKRAEAAGTAERWPVRPYSPEQLTALKSTFASLPKLSPEEVDQRNAAVWLNSDALAGNAAGAPEPPYWEVRDVSEIFAPLEPVNYLVEPLDICAGAPTLFAGYGFSGKTVACQSMAVSIASGQKVWGCYDARRGRVIHIDYEQGFRLTRERYQRLALGMDVTPNELDGRLHVVAMPQVYLDNPQREAFLTKQVEGYDLAIVDSLRACGPSIEENDSSVRGLLDMLNRISDKTGCCFIVIHHARKPSRDGSNAGGAKMAIRGSGAIFDACASVVILEAEKGKPAKVTHEKARTSGICADDFLLTISDREAGGSARGGLVVTAESQPTAGSASGAFEALKKRVLAELATGPAASKTALAARVSGKSGDKFGAIAQLIQDGKIVENGKALSLKP